MRRKIAAIDGNGRGVCVEIEVPELCQGEVLVRVVASLISPGTELGRVGVLRANPTPAVEPRPFGYTNAGIVEKVGSAVEQFEVGEGVACMGGGYALHTDWACVPQNLCVSVPAGVSFEQAASVHLAATGLHAVRRIAPLYGENGVVYGLGLVGQFAAQFAQLSGCHIQGVDRFSLRQDIARRIGIEGIVDATDQDPVTTSIKKIIERPTRLRINTSHFKKQHRLLPIHPNGPDNGKQRTACQRNGQTSADNWQRFSTSNSPC